MTGRRVDRPERQAAREAIARLFKDGGWTLESVAKQIGWTRQRFDEFLHRRKVPEFATLEKVARGLGVGVPAEDLAETVGTLIIARHLFCALSAAVEEYVRDRGLAGREREQETRALFGRWGDPVVEAVTEAQRAAHEDRIADLALVFLRHTEALSFLPYEVTPASVGYAAIPITRRALRLILDDRFETALDETRRELHVTVTRALLGPGTTDEAVSLVAELLTAIRPRLLRERASWDVNAIPAGGTADDDLVPVVMPASE